MDNEKINFGDVENTNYINTEEALKIIRKILSDVAYDLEDDDFVLIEDDGVIIGKAEDFDEDVLVCAIPAEDLVEFTDGNNFIINDAVIRQAIEDLF